MSKLYNFVLGKLSFRPNTNTMLPQRINRFEICKTRTKTFIRCGALIDKTKVDHRSEKSRFGYIK